MMRERAKKALKHDVELLGKRVPVLLVAALFVIGAGSAAVLQTFGSVSGTATVDNEAIDAPELKDSYSGETAPVTHYNEMTVTNNNQERFVDYQLEALSDDTFADHDNAYRQVYRVQNFVAEPEGETVEDAGLVSISATPNVDEVRYEIDLDQSYDSGAVSLEVSRQDGDNYHIGYYPTGDGNPWFIKDPSADGDAVEIDDVSNFEEVRDVSVVETQDDGDAATLEIELKREIGYQQTFGVNVYEQSKGGPPENTNWRTEGYTYSDSGTEAHLTLDTTDYIGAEETIVPSSSQEYNLGVYLDSATPENEDYELDVGVTPATQSTSQ